MVVAATVSRSSPPGTRAGSSFADRPVSPKRRTCPASTRGYTLVELAVVVAMVGVVSLLSFNSIRGLRARAEFASVTGALASDLQTAHHRASADQRDVVVVFLMSADPDSTERERYYVVSDPDGVFKLDEFDPEDIDEDLIVLSEKRFLSHVRFGPEEGYGDELPPPFQGVPADSACTFCTDGFEPPFERRGALTFLPDGTVALSGGGESGSVTVYDADEGGRLSTVAITGRTGAVRSFLP